MPSTIYSQDVERQVDPSVRTHPQESKNIPTLQERAREGCFLCLKSHNQEPYAILVPCVRPSKARRGEKRRRDRTGDSDEDIYRRLRKTCYQHLGWWKRWLPYYGITEVLEVNFQFADFVEPDGRYPIRMKPIDLENALEECEKIIAIISTNPSFNLSDTCSGVNGHSEECEIGMEEWGQPCTWVEAEKVKKRYKRLLSLPLLKKNIRNPERAKGLYTLEGSEQEGFLYNTEGPGKAKLPLPDEQFWETTWIRGIHLILGWQTDRMQRKLPFKLSFAWFGIASIWLSLVVWRGLGEDWGTAFAFAQVVAASVAIIITGV